MTKYLLAGAAMLAVSTAALADEPHKLSDDQLLGVAGGQPPFDNGFVPPPFQNGNGPDFSLVLEVQTTNIHSTQTNAAHQSQHGAAVALLGGASVSQIGSIVQTNTN